MFRFLIAAFLGLLMAANLFVLVALNSGKGNQTRETKMGICFLSAVIVFNIVFSLGGVLLW